MPKTINLYLLFALELLFQPFLLSQDVTAVSYGEEVAASLDLSAVVQVLKEVKDPEALEQALNDPDLGLNNLDLNEDGFVDYIRVVTEHDVDTHVIILQVPLDEHEVQDIATIEVEKSSKGEVQFQVHGHHMIYGPDYYLRPVGVAFASFAFVNWLFSPNYRPWRSTYYIGAYPRWYRTWRIVPRSVYAPRVKRYTTVRVGTYRKSVVVRAPRVYTHRSTTVVRKPGKTTVTRTTVQAKPKKKTVTTKKTKVTKTKTGKTKKVKKKTTTKTKRKKRD